MNQVPHKSGAARWPEMLVLLGLAFGCNVAISSWLGKRAGRSEALGAPMVGVLYGPTAWVKWTQRYGVKPRGLLFVGAAVGGVANFSFAVGLLALLVVKRRNPEPVRDLHGTARFSTLSEMRAAGLLAEVSERGDPTVLLGSVRVRGGLRMLHCREAYHFLLSAPTGGGKTTSFVIPNALHWSASLVVLDLKGEIFEQTAGWRAKMGHRILRHQPLGDETRNHSRNPLADIRLYSGSDSDDAENIAAAIVPPDGRSTGNKSHWVTAARTLLSGLILHVAYEARRSNRLPTLSEIADIVKSPKRDSVFSEMAQNRHLGGRPHRYVAAVGASMAKGARGQNEGPDVINTLGERLGLFLNERVVANTTKNDFSPSDLFDRSRPTTLYVQVPFEDLERTAPLLRILFAQILKASTDIVGAPCKASSGSRSSDGFAQWLRGIWNSWGERAGETIDSSRMRAGWVLMLLDELARLGRLDVLHDAFSWVAGRGVQICAIVQSLNQLRQSYGQQETITENCGVKIFSTPDTTQAAKEISNELGEQTVCIEKTTVSGRRWSWSLGSASEGIEMVRRPLMTPDEIGAMRSLSVTRRGMRRGRQLLFVRGMRPIACDQLVHFADETFSARAAVPAPTIEKGAIAEHRRPRSMFKLREVSK